MKRLKCRIRRIKKKLAYYLLGYIPINHEEERERNLKYLYTVCYEWNNVVTDKYDFFYHVHHDDSEAKKRTLEFFNEPIKIIA
jgi:hypothetical protein